MTEKNRLNSFLFGSFFKKEQDEHSRRKMGIGHVAVGIDSSLRKAYK